MREQSKIEERREKGSVLGPDQQQPTAPNPGQATNRQVLQVCQLALAGGAKSDLPKLASQQIARWWSPHVWAAKKM